MSVINQMLKDLEERTPNTSSNHQTVAVVQKTSSVKVIFITLFILLVLNGLGLYIWSLVQENKELKEKTVILNAVKLTAQVEKRELKPELKSEVRPGSKSEVIKPRVEQTYRSEKTVISSNGKIDSGEGNVLINETAPLVSIPTKLSPTKSTQIKSIQVQPVPLNATVSKQVKLKPKASMSVSSRQLRPEELIERKLAQAEVSININNLSKAEQLFEDVLIIDPNQQHARKKLAALWFGRKAFVDAINLLSQGIALAPENSEFRSMQAHVFLQEGNLTQAYNSLKPLDDLVDQSYQLLIANISQQISQYDATIKAYKILLELQPVNSRWHLGLAIVYDKNSQFVLAVSEYNVALEQGGLSNDSSHFANQRIQALGVQ